MKQVWVNLLSNAVKYSSKKENPMIEVGSYADGPSVCYFVRDNGVGFDMGYTNQLFKVFQRLHREDEFAGTGVGLALVKKIITRQGGSVWAESSPGNGATFYFSLPNH
jgi:light-regulated signal transduction histidine kinase (bacteriophytochrome)